VPYLQKFVNTFKGKHSIKYFIYATDWDVEKVIALFREKMR